MKSQAIPEILIVGVIGTIAIIGGILMPPVIIKTTIDKEITFTYEYEKIQHTLLALLSSTHESKPVYEIIADNVTNIPTSLDFLKPNLDKIFGSKCYSLQVGNANYFTTLIENSVCEKKYTFTTVIILPYNPEPDSRVKLLRIGIG